MPAVANRMNTFSESVISEMTVLAEKYNAINLSQGSPDFNPPDVLIEAAKRVMDGDFHQYAITYGSPAFRQALASKQQHFMGINLDPTSNIVVTNGSTEAMLVSLFTICNPGDKVIVFTPFFESYPAAILLCGAQPIYVTLHYPDFNFDQNELRTAFSKGVKAIIICNPSNPTGKVFSREELLFLGSLAQEFDTYVITDEVYEHIVYEPNHHTYMASLPGMFERTISCSSLSKTYSITGWRLGYAIAPEGIINCVKKVHDYTTLGTAAPLQEAAVAALALPDKYYQILVEGYAQKRDAFIDQLKKAGLSCTTPQGAYFTLIDITNTGFKNDIEFCHWMVKNIGIAALPGSSLFPDGGHHLIRLHFAKKEETLSEAGLRLQKIKTLI